MSFIKKLMGSVVGWACFFAHAENNRWARTRGHKNRAHPTVLTLE